MRLVRTLPLKPVLLATSFFLLGVVAVLTYPVKLSDKNATIEAAYVRYSCGECYVQYRILKAAPKGEALTTQRSTESESTTPIRFIGWDVLVFYKGDDQTLSEYLDKHYDKSGGCREPVFRLQGQLKRKLIYALIYRGDQYDGTYFDAQSAVAVGDPSPTCKQAKETTL